MSAETTPATNGSHYSRVAIILHWAIALSILLMIPMGLLMHRAQDAGGGKLVFQIYQFHKSLGLTILTLSVIRLIWRLTHKAPPLPASMPLWEKIAAKATHWIFYYLIIAMPLTGWVYVSTGWSVHTGKPLMLPTIWFGLFQWPHLPGLAESPTRAITADAAMEWHERLAFISLALVALHVGAALKHHFKDKDETLEHMIPGARKSLLWPGVVTAAAALSFAFVAYAFTIPDNDENEAAPAQVAVIDSIAPEAAPEPSQVTPIKEEAPKASVTAPAGKDAPPAWNVDKGASKIEFSGDGATGPFTGSFGSWNADIRFSPDNLATSRAVVTIQMGSATIPDPTGKAMLREDDWFGVGKFPTAKFTTSTFKHLGGDKYEAAGVLEMKGISSPVRLPFTLTIAGKTATMKGSAQIDRLKWKVGEGTATKGGGEDSWASGAIGVSVSLRATQ